MSKFFASAHDHLIELWSHRLTAFIGVSLGSASSFCDLVNKLLGTAAICIGIYFSVQKGLRETRNAASKAGDRPTP